jgi:hypothetical protein
MQPYDVPRIAVLIMGIVGVYVMVALPGSAKAGTVGAMSGSGDQTTMSQESLHELGGIIYRRINLGFDPDLGIDNEVLIRVPDSAAAEKEGVTSPDISGPAGGFERPLIAPEHDHVLNPG